MARAQVRVNKELYFDITATVAATPFKQPSIVYGMPAFIEYDNIDVQELEINGISIDLKKLKKAGFKDLAELFTEFVEEQIDDIDDYEWDFIAY